MKQHRIPTNIDEQIDIDEGNVLVAYPDPLTKSDPWTIGRGHTGPEVHKGLVWTEQQSEQARDKDILHATQECLNAFPWFKNMNQPRQAVLIGMVFQLGMPRVRGFKKALSAMSQGLWATAEAELLDSAWHHQTPDRCERRAEQMKTGEWQ